MAFESQFVRSNAGTDIIKTGDSGHDADFEVKEDDNGNFELAEKRRQEAHSSAPVSIQSILFFIFSNPNISI